MQINQLPTERNATTPLWARIDENDNVEWSLNVMELKRDDLEWFFVWRDNGIIHLEAIQWFHCHGHFSMAMTDKTPEEAVRLAEKCATLVAGDGG